MQNNLKSSLLTYGKGQQMDSLLEELIQRTLDVWNHKMKRNVIFVG
jgi:hypothetical protein